VSADEDAEADMMAAAGRTRANFGANRKTIADVWPMITARIRAIKSGAKARHPPPPNRAVAPRASLKEDGMNSPESPPWGFLQWAVAGLASLAASAAAFVWRLMTRLHALEIAARQHQHDLDASQSANESALLRLAERLALLHDDHYRLRETIGTLPSRADIHDLELRLGERMESLAVRFDRAFDPRVS
jgi:hypothetical protein